jgi:hypothetical protein
MSVVQSWNGVDSLLGLYLIEKTFGSGSIYNKTLPVGAGFRVHYVRDIQPPLPVDNFKVVAVNCSTITVTWKASLSPDAETIRICASDSSMPFAWDQGKYFSDVSASVTEVTITGLPSHGVNLFVASFVQDFAGNRSPHHPGSAGMIELPDGIPPVNMIIAKVVNLNDTAINVALRIPATRETDIRGIQFYWGPFSHQKRLIDSSFFNYQDTVFTIHHTVLQGWWGVAWAPVDSSGNIGDFKEDSIYISNTAPRISLANAYTLYENKPWQALSFVSDVNNDDITVTVSGMPDAMVLTKQPLSLTWKPFGKDVGTHTIVVAANDHNGGNDTVVVALLVNNIVDTPKVVSAQIPAEVYEGKELIGTMVLRDGDWNDSLRIRVEPVSWLNVRSILHTPADSFWTVTLGGVPARNDTGRLVYTVQATDNYNAVTSMKDTIVVHIVNNQPVVMKHTLSDTGVQDSLFTGTITIADRDQGDSVKASVETSMPWLAIVRVEHNPADTIWTFYCSGKPAQKDTGLKHYTFTVADLAGAKVSVQKTVRILDKDDPPVTLLTRKEKSFGALQYIMQALDDYDTVFTYFASLRKTAGSFAGNDSGKTGVFCYYPLTDGIYVFTCYAQDMHGLADPKPYADTIVIKSASHFTVKDTGSWSMLSVPARSYSAASVKDAGALLRWDESQAENGIYKYYTKSGSIMSMLRGEAYWLKQKKELSITLEQSQFVTDTAKVVLRKAEYGWNQIASPYPYPVKWNKKYTLWEWNPVTRDFEESEGILYPWRGYWVLVDKQDTATFAPIPQFVSKAYSKRNKSCFIAADEWSFSISLTTNVNSDADNIFGVSAHARDGYDELDRPEPPRMNNEPFIFFAHPEWNKPISMYASDIRASTTDQSSLFQIGIAPGAKEINQMFLNISGMTPDMPLYLFIYSPDGLIEYKNGMSVAVASSDREQYRTIFVTSDINFLASFPWSFSMRHPYPNPFRSSANIQYTLPYQMEKNGLLTTRGYAVSMIIYDMKGRQIRVLVDRPQKAGHYKVFWRGDSNSGRRIASGVYLCRLRAGTFTDVKRMIVSY